MPARTPTRRALLGAAGTALAAGSALTTLASSATDDTGATDQGLAASTAASSVTDAWPAYHGTPGNRGYVPGATGPTEAVELAWTYDRGGQMAIVDDTVYVQATDGVHALDAADGAVRWTADDIGADGGLSVTADAVYVGGAQLTALEAATGDVRWVVEEAVTAPVVADGAVYTMAGSTLAAYDAATGTTRWTFTPEVDETLYPETSVAVAAGTVVTVSPSFVFARDAADGSELWTYDGGPPDDAAGPRFEGAQPHHLAATDAVVAVPEYTGAGAELIGIYDVETGERQWRTDGGGIEGANRVTITDERLYVRGRYGTGGLDRDTRDAEWSADHDYVDDGAGGLPVATDEAVYVATHDGLVAFDETDDDDAMLWSLDPDDVDWPNRETPIEGVWLAVAGDTLYASDPAAQGNGLAAYRMSSEDDESTDGDEGDEGGDGDDGTDGADDGTDEDDTDSGGC